VSTGPSTGAGAARARGGERATAPAARRRLSGVDVARAVALLAMMATHALPLEEAGRPTLTGAVASGRASALFAVLAGVGLALLTGGPRPLGGRPLAVARRGVLARAAVIAVLGLVLGLWPSGVAVILVNYGLLFAVATVFLGLRARALVPLAAAWLLLAPVLSHVLRARVPEPSLAVPSLASASSPVQALTELLLTGYYPVLTWTGYLLLGLAAGRLPLQRARAAAAVLAAGAVAATAAWLASDPLLRAAGGVAALAATLPPRDRLRGATTAAQLQEGFYGTTPTTAWGWLAVRAPHSGTPVDLVHTGGCALAVLGLCLLVTRWGPAALALTPLAAAGAMTLTLYTLHVVSLPVLVLLLGGPATYGVSVVAGLAFATAWRLGAQHGPLPRRGPLEQLAAGASALARGRSGAG
jgi:uncharacterized membrane protein